MRQFVRHAVFLLPALIATPLAAQTSTPAETAQVMILGTYHFDNPGLDVVKTEIADVLAPAKQAEIERIVDALARFRPTRVAVEAMPESAPALDSAYVAYRAGRHTLTRNEVQQLGFRLAARFDHARVHPIDHGGEFPFGPLMQYAGEHDPAAAQYIQTMIQGIGEESARQHRELDIAGILRIDNDPAIIRQEHGAGYVRVNEVGAGDTFVGSDVLSGWYDRNIRIFANVQKLAQPGERVLVIIGAGHAAILRELVGYDPRLELVEAIEYLP